MPVSEAQRQEIEQLRDGTNSTLPGHGSGP